MRTPRAWWRARQERKARREKAREIETAVETGFWTVNQAREHLGLPPEPDGWVIYDGPLSATGRFVMPENDYLSEPLRSMVQEETYRQLAEMIAPRVAVLMEER